MNLPQSERYRTRQEGLNFYIMEQEEIKSIEFYVPVKHIAPMKKAAIEMGLDIFIDTQIIQYVNCSWKKVIIIGTISTIFSLGYLTGMNVYDIIAVNPLREAMDILQNKITDFVKENPDTQKIIDDIDKKYNNESDTTI